MLGLILQHPSAPVNFDPPATDCGCVIQAEHGMCKHSYPQTKLSILSAYADNCVKRHELGIPLLPRPKLKQKLSDAERLDNYEAIRRLAQRIGSYRLLLTIVRNVAEQDGEIVDFKEGAL